MNRRPLGIVILSMLHVLAPLVNLITTAWWFNIPVDTYIRSILMLSWPEKLEFFLLFPLAGWAIFQVKRWSYPVFLAVMAIGLWRHLDNRMSYPNFISTGLIVAVWAANLAVVAYFLLPQVRKFYLNRRLRWWESQPRFPVKSPCVFRYAGAGNSNPGENSSEILEFSVEGIFIRTEAALAIGDRLEVRFSLLDKDFNLPAQVAHRGIGMRKGYGIQWISLSFLEKRKLNAIAVELKRVVGLPSSMENPSRWEEMTAVLQEKIPSLFGRSGR